MQTAQQVRTWNQLLVMYERLLKNFRKIFKISSGWIPYSKSFLCFNPKKNKFEKSHKAKGGKLFEFIWSFA